MESPVELLFVVGWRGRRGCCTWDAVVTVRRVRWMRREVGESILAIESDLFQADLIRSEQEMRCQADA